MSEDLALKYFVSSAPIDTKHDRTSQTLGDYGKLKEKFEAGSITSEESRRFVKQSLEGLMIERDAMAETHRESEPGILFRKYLNQVSEVQENIFTVIQRKSLTPEDFRVIASEVGAKEVGKNTTRYTDVRRHLGVWMPYSKEDLTGYKYLTENSKPTEIEHSKEKQVTTRFSPQKQGSS